MKSEVQPAERARSVAVVLFDGVCNLCNAYVNFVIDRDPEGCFRFAALQSEASRPVLEKCRLPSHLLEGIVLFEDGRCYARSTAALRICRRLNGLWPLLYGLILVPRPLRDAVYGWIVRNRYRWFGKRESCRVPTPELAGRFLPDAARSRAPEA